MEELLRSVALMKSTKVNQVKDAAIEFVDFQNSVLIELSVRNTTISVSALKFHFV
jgi:hypothetical protein